MEPAGQAVYSGMFGSAFVGEGLYFADRTTPATPRPGFAGEERGEGQIWGQDQP